MDLNTLYKKSPTNTSFYENLLRDYKGPDRPIIDEGINYLQEKGVDADIELIKPTIDDLIRLGRKKIGKPEEPGTRTLTKKQEAAPTIPAFYQTLLKDYKGEDRPIINAGIDYLQEKGIDVDRELIKPTIEDLKRLGTERLKPKEPEEAGRGFIAEAGRGLAHGVISLGETVGTSFQYVGGKIGSEFIEKNLGKTAHEYWEKVAERYEISPELRGAVVRKPGLLLKAAWWAYNIADMIPSLAVALIPAVGAKKYITALGKAYKWTPKLVERLAMLGATVAGGGIGGMLEGAHTYQEVLERGGTKDQAEAAMEMMTFVAGALNAISIGRMVKKGKLINLRRFLKTGATESITEYLEEPAEIGIKRALLTEEQFTSHDAIEQLKQGINVMGPAFVTGMLGGAGATKAAKETEQPAAIAPADNASAIKDIGREGAEIKEKIYEEDEETRIRERAKTIFNQFVPEEERITPEGPPTAGVPPEVVAEEEITIEENKQYQDLVEDKFNELAPDDEKEQEKLRSEFFKDRLAPWWANTPYDQKVKELEEFSEMKREEPAIETVARPIEEEVPEEGLIKEEITPVTEIAREEGEKKMEAAKVEIEPVKDILARPEAKESEVIKEKRKLKNQIIEGVKAGTFTGAVRFGTVDEIKSALKEGKLPISKEHAEIHAQPIMGKEDDAFAAYGAYDKHNMAMVIPEKYVETKPDAHTKEVVIDPDVPLKEIRYLIDGHEKIYTYDELVKTLKEEVKKPAISPAGKLVSAHDALQNLGKPNLAEIEVAKAMDEGSDPVAAYRKYFTDEGRLYGGDKKSKNAAERIMARIKQAQAATEPKIIPGEEKKEPVIEPAAKAIPEVKEEEKLPVEAKPAIEIEERKKTPKGFYKPGNIIWDSYWKKKDKVLNYKEESDGTWEVQVQEIDDEGKLIGNPRWHSTFPDKKDKVLKEAEQLSVEEPTKKPPAKEPAGKPAQAVAALTGKKVKEGLEIVEEEGYTVKKVSENKQGGKWIIDYNDNYKGYLYMLLEEVNQGEAGQKIRTVDAEGKETWTYQDSTYPEFMKKKGWHTTKTVIPALEKAIKGEELSKNQMAAVQAALEESKVRYEHDKEDVAGLKKEYYKDKKEDSDAGIYKREEIEGNEEEVRGTTQEGLESEEADNEENLKELTAFFKEVSTPKFELTPTEPTPEEKIAIGKARGEIVSPEKEGKKAVIPEEKIPVATKGEQRAILPPKEGEQVSIEEAIEKGKPAEEIKEPPSVEQYATGKYPVAEIPGVSLKEFQSVFKGQDIKETPEGNYRITTKYGGSVELRIVNKIDENAVAFELGYGRPRKKGEKIVGKYEDRVIELHREEAGRWTLTHESYHFLEDAGIISKADIRILQNKIRALAKKGQFTPMDENNVGFAEDRAEFIAKQLSGIYDTKSTTGKIILKVQTFIDKLLGALGIRPAGAVVREIETGEIFEKPVKGEKGLLIDAEKSPAFYAISKEPAGIKAPPDISAITGGAREKVETTKKLLTHVKEFFKPFSTLPEGEKALSARYEGMGNVARATRFIDRIHKKLDIYPDDVKQDIFRFLDGQVPVDVLPEEAQKLAESLKQRTLTIGRMLLKRGILTEEQFNEYKGKYIHYMYAKHVLGDAGSIGMTSTGKLNLSYTKKRNPDLTPDQRKTLGLIEDASVAVPVGMGKALTDIAKFDYMEKIAGNDKWTWQPSIIEAPLGKEGKLTRIGIGKLVEEAATYEKMAKETASQEVKNRYKALKDALDTAMEQTANVPEDFVELPTTKTYGPLAGAYIRKPIASDIIPLVSSIKDKGQIGKLFNTILNVEAQSIALFKIGKVALNLPTACRNVISNILQNNMRGRPLAMIPGDIVNGCRSILAKDKYYEESFRHGIFKTNWFVTEINEVLEEFNKAEKGGYAGFINTVKNMAKYYGKIDDIAKHSIFLQLRKEGKPVDEAILEAMKWGMDYSLASRSVKGLRKHLIPFASYQYKVAPLILESLQKRPWVIGKFALLIPMIVKEWASQYNDMDDDDWKELEKQLPIYVKKSGSMMILPRKTPEGQWQYMNLEYFFPWGNYLNIFRDVKEKDMGEIYRGLGISNPFLDIARMFASAREDKPPQHPFYGRPIYNRLDSPAMKVAKLTEFLSFTWLPAMLNPRHGALGYSYKAAAGTEDRWGRSVTPAQAIGRWFGANIVSVSPEQTMAIASVKLQEIRKELSRIQKDPRKSEKAKEAAESRYREKLAEMAEASPGAILPITKAKGKDEAYEALMELLKKGELTMGPPNRSLQLRGVTEQMTLEQYNTYLEESSDIARRKLSRMIASTSWDRWPDNIKVKKISSIINNARKRTRGKIKRRMLREKYQTAKIVKTET